MKASDICIGDWLNIYNFPNDNPKHDDLFSAKLSAVFIFEPFKEPDVVDVELVFKNKEGGNAIASRPLDTCLPIPLTEDILTKNGFGKVNNQYFLGQVEIKELRDCWVVIINKEDADIDINIHYVHELQHILRLCGIEKEIEL